jgi:D-tyrosyl-tRNA(Tyr) deacylase
VRLVLQRVLSAAVRVDGETVGAIDRGLLILIGVERGDDLDAVDRAAAKLAELRVFEDGAGRMTDSALDVEAEVLVVSQFTLAGSLAKGRRPSFDNAAPAAEAVPLIERLVAALRTRGLRVETGRFQANMEVELINDGPVTFVVDF